MEIGMLWFDNDQQRPLVDKVKRAGVYYARKYGATPTVCFVHPGMLADAVKAVDGMALRASQTLLPNHFWIGVSDGS